MKKLKNYPNLEPMRKLVAGLAPDIAAAVQQGASRASQLDGAKASLWTDGAVLRFVAPLRRLSPAIFSHKSTRYWNRKYLMPMRP